LIAREDVLVLQRETMRLSLDPPRGGSIRGLVWRGRDVLRSTPDSAGDDPFDASCFAMLPYVNRVADGRFGFAGRSVQLDRNWSDDPHPLHGQGWRTPWFVVEACKSAATLRFEGGADQWPWRYRGEQRFELMPDGLMIELSIENLSDEPMPAMLGLHPYFPDAGHAQLHARLPRMWLTDRAALAVKETQTEPRYGFEPARAIHDIPLDHCFSGWGGVAWLRWPDRAVTLRATGCNHLHVYAPADRDFFCVEPQTAAPGALGRNAGEVTVVAPRDFEKIRVHFAVEEA
jgi:aldose 1-epimerase